VVIARPENDIEGQGYVVAFQEGLEQLGWKPGGNVEIDYRWTSGNAKLAESFAKELTALKPDILVVNSSATVLAVRQGRMSAFGGKADVRFTIRNVCL
jgi:putative ABC transport system substrate-binding protein